MVVTSPHGPRLLPCAFDEFIEPCMTMVTQFAVLRVPILGFDPIKEPAAKNGLMPTILMLNLEERGNGRWVDGQIRASAPGQQFVLFSLCHLQKCVIFEEP